MKISTGAVDYFENSLGESNTTWRDPETGLGKTRFGRSSVKKGPVYDPSRTLIPYDPAFAELQKYREGIHSFWKSKRTGLLSSYYQRYKEAEASGNHEESIYYRARLGIGIKKRRSSEAHSIVEKYHAKIESRTAESEARRRQADASRRYERGRKAKMRLDFDQLKWAGNYTEAADILADLEGINYSDREEFKNTWIAQQNERARRKRARIEAANLRRDERERERAYKQQERDESFAARQDAIAERERRRNEERTIAADAKEMRRREAEQRKQYKLMREDAKRQRASTAVNSKSLMANTGALAKLTRFFVRGGGWMLVAAQGVKQAAETGNEVREKALNYRNFGDMHGLSADDMAKISEISKQQGVDDKSVFGYMGKLSHELANVEFGDNRIFERAKYFAGLNVYNKDGSMKNSKQMMSELARYYKQTSGRERIRFASRWGINEDMATVLDSWEDRGKVDTTGKLAAFGGAKKVNKYTEYLNRANADYDARTDAEYARGGIGYVNGAFRTIGKYTGIRRLANWWNYDESFEGMMRKSGTQQHIAAQNQANIERYKDETAMGRGQTIVVNLGGQKMTFNGKSSSEVMRQVMDYYGEEVAKTVVNQFQILEAD